MQLFNFFMDNNTYVDFSHQLDKVDLVIFYGAKRMNSYMYVLHTNFQIYCMYVFHIFTQ